MKIYHRIICVALCLALILCLFSCSSNPTDKPTVSENNTSATYSATTSGSAITIVFSEKFLNVAEMSPEGWMESLNNLGSDQYVNLQISNDGKSVALDITDSQKEFWLSVVNNGLLKLTSNLKNINDNYNIQYSEDYSCIDLYYDLNLPATDAIYYVIYCEVYCAFGQMLNGTDPHSWTVNFNIYNSETDKLVTNGDSDTGLSYESSDWEESK